MMFRYSEADVRKVRRVQFGILGPEELKRTSVCAITTDRTFENGRPVAGGLMDNALGAIDRGLPCGSCGMDEQECPGHFGHLELCKPMYHVSFINTVLKTLRCVCFSCSVILGDEPPVDGQPTLDSQRIAAATRKKHPVQRLRAVMDIAKTKKMCWSCSAPQPKFKRDCLAINAEFETATDVRFLPLEEPVNDDACRGRGDGQGGGRWWRGATRGRGRLRIFQRDPMRFVTHILPRPSMCYARASELT